MKSGMMCEIFMKLASLFLHPHYINNFFWKKKISQNLVHVVWVQNKTKMQIGDCIMTYTHVCDDAQPRKHEEHFEPDSWKQMGTVIYDCPI